MSATPNPTSEPPAVVPREPKPPEQWQDLRDLLNFRPQVPYAKVRLEIHRVIPGKKPPPPKADDAVFRAIMWFSKEEGTPLWSAMDTQCLIATVFDGVPLDVEGLYFALYFVDVWVPGREDKGAINRTYPHALVGHFKFTRADGAAADAIVDHNERGGNSDSQHQYLSIERSGAGSQPLSAEEDSPATQLGRLCNPGEVSLQDMEPADSPDVGMLSDGVAGSQPESYLESRPESPSGSDDDDEADDDEADDDADADEESREHAPHFSQDAQRTDDATQHRVLDFPGDDEEDSMAGADDDETPAPKKKARRQKGKTKNPKKSASTSGADAEKDRENMWEIENHGSDRKTPAAQPAATAATTNGGGDGGGEGAGSGSIVFTLAHKDTLKRLDANEATKKFTDTVLRFIATHMKPLVKNVMDPKKPDTEPKKPKTDAHLNAFRAAIALLNHAKLFMGNKGYSVNFYTSVFNEVVNKMRSGKQSMELLEPHTERPMATVLLNNTVTFKDVVRLYNEPEFGPHIVAHEEYLRERREKDAANKAKKAAAEKAKKDAVPGPEDGAGDDDDVVVVGEKGPEAPAKRPKKDKRPRSPTKPKPKPGSPSSPSKARVVPKTDTANAILSGKPTPPDTESESKRRKKQAATVTAAAAAARKPKPSPLPPLPNPTPTHTPKTKPTPQPKKPSGSDKTRDAGTTTNTSVPVPPAKGRAPPAAANGDTRSPAAAGSGTSPSTHEAKGAGPFDPSGVESATEPTPKPTSKGRQPTGVSAPTGSDDFVTVSSAAAPGLTPPPAAAAPAAAQPRAHMPTGLASIPARAESIAVATLPQNVSHDTTFADITDGVIQIKRSGAPTRAASRFAKKLISTRSKSYEKALRATIASGEVPDMPRVTMRLRMHKHMPYRRAFTNVALDIFHKWQTVAHRNGDLEALFAINRMETILLPLHAEADLGEDGSQEMDAVDDVIDTAFDAEDPEFFHAAEDDDDDAPAPGQ